MQVFSHYPHPCVDDREPFQLRYFLAPGAMWMAVLLSAFLFDGAPGTAATPALAEVEAPAIVAA